MTLTILRMELRRLLAAPLAWVMLAATQLILGISFTLGLGELEEQPELAHHIGVTAHIASTIYGFAVVWFLLAVPLLAMRLLADEFRSGTVRLLRTSAARPWQVVLGKYLALLVLFGVMIGLAAAMTASLATGTHLEWGLLGVATLGVFLLTCSYGAVALACSSTTRQPAAAAASAFGILLLLWLLYWVGTRHVPLAAVYRFLSPAGHLQDAFRGLLDVRMLVYFPLVVVAGLTLAALRLAVAGGTPRSTVRRLARPGTLACGLAALAAMVVLAAIAVADGQSWDLSANGRNSLAPASIRLLHQLPRKLHVIAYAPPNGDLRGRIRHLLGRYRRYKPNMTVAFVNPQAAPEVLRRLGATGRWTIAFTYGSRTEICSHLSETCASEALQRLARGPGQWVVFLSGHGERPLDDSSEDAIGHFADRLRESGMHVRSLNLAADPTIPDNTTVLVIASPQVDYLSGEVGLIRDYIRRGGDVLWLAEPGSRLGLGPVARALGVRLGKGVVVYPDYRLLGMPSPTVVPVTNFGDSPITSKLSGIAVLAGARPVDPRKHSTWQVAPLLKSLARSWAETGPMKGTIRYNPDRGDTAGPLTLGLALTRQMHGHQQRAVVFGDGDFLSNRYLERGDNLQLGLNAVNWLAGADRQLNIAPRRLPDHDLTLGPRLAIGLPLLFAVLIPLGMLVGGFLWLRRRR
ncbi:MAG TPA: DUF4350 domain-containing protein [Gammaproteobacteria bacterium]|nr:DUF4350 domain-containing protein [Gammaproteobacteria bacterium]